MIKKLRVKKNRCDLKKDLAQLCSALAKNRSSKSFSARSDVRTRFSTMTDEARGCAHRTRVKLKLFIKNNLKSEFEIGMMKITDKQELNSFLYLDR